MEEELPGTKRLTLTWFMLITLTALSMWSAQLDPAELWLPLPLWGVAIVLLCSALKVQQILMIYLNLRVSSAGWKGGFLSVLLGTVVLVFFGYLAAPLS